ncbi:RsmD family RNA methyltransferase [Sunxiuqinia sp. A32]|uniref:RsmD family RNA methyltransferase n=1 Tax=Sunxiuqinia sp. A32 TaxID=3461496 RepID=UPI0040455EE1
MRIVGGKYRGRQFHPGKAFKARPTTDMAKESIFNILQNKIDFDTIKVLDLFAGTGSISFEFASRGCTDITAVELNYNHFKFIKDTVEKLGEKGVKVIKGNAFQFVQKDVQQYDIVFADPPYDHPRFSEIPEMILKSNLIKESGLFILEHSKNYDFSMLPNYSETRKYGSVHFAIFNK